MSDHQDYLERTLDAPAHVAMAKIEKARNPHTAIWWIAAAVAVAAVVGALFILRTTRPSAQALQAAQSQGAATARVDAVSHGPQLAVARAVQAATVGRTQTTEASAQAAAQDASATVAASGP
jgi:hypothetical protein